MNKRKVLLVLTSVAAFAFGGTNCHAVQPDVGASSASPLLKFSPPLRGAPSSRLGGGTRSMQTLVLIAPKTDPYTTKAQPTLYWFLPKAVSGKLVLVLTHVANGTVVAERAFEGSFERGIYGINLAQLGISLNENDKYEWSVRSGSNGSAIATSALIQRVSATETLKRALAGSADAVDAYAAAGMWYDAIAAISERIDANPNDPVLHDRRVELLGQHRLSSVVDYDQGK